MKQKGQGDIYPRVNVSSNLAATFTCPHCGISRRKDVSGFLSTEKNVKIKCRCRCRQSFRVILEKWHPPEKEAFSREHQKIRWVVKKQRSVYIKDVLLLFSLLLIVLISIFYLFFDGPSGFSPESFPGTNNGDEIKSIYDSGG